MLDALTLDQMRTFVAVADAGSFRGAGLRLARAQSAISHAIGNLETQLGIDLFDRTAHRPILTVGGRNLLEDVRSVLLKVDHLRAKARGLGEGLEVELSIVLDTLFPINLAASALRDLHAAFPTVAVRVTVGTLGEPIQALNERKCDLAITVGDDLRTDRLEFEALLSIDFVAVAAASHPLATSSKVRSAELAEHLQIVLQDPSEMSRGRDFGVLSPRSWRVIGQDTKLALIRAGVGWGRLPYWAIEEDLIAKKLVQLEAPALGVLGKRAVQAFLAHKVDQPLLPAARFFREALIARDHEA